MICCKTEVHCLRWGNKVFRSGWQCSSRQTSSCPHLGYSPEAQLQPIWWSSLCRPVNISCFPLLWEMGQQYLNPIIQKTKDWRGGSGILLVGVCLVQIFDIDNISLYILVLPFVCLATNNLGWWPYELWISLLYGSHRFLHVIPQGVTLMPQDECRVDMAQRRSACTVSSPRIARTEEPSYVPFQFLICPLVKCPCSGIE